METYGVPVTLLPNGEEGDCLTTFAFFQPILDKNLQFAPSPLGWERRERWLYLGPPSVRMELPPAGFVRTLGREFDVFAARKVCIGRGENHWWAILTPREEAS